MRCKLPYIWAYILFFLSFFQTVRQGIEIVTRWIVDFRFVLAIPGFLLRGQYAVTADVTLAMTVKFGKTLKPSLNRRVINNTDFSRNAADRWVEQYRICFLLECDYLIVGEQRLLLGSIIPKNLLSTSLLVTRNTEGPSKAGWNHGRHVKAYIKFVKSSLCTMLQMIIIIVIAASI